MQEQSRAHTGRTKAVEDDEDRRRVVAKLSLSILAGAARDSIADLLRDARLPGSPVMVKKDGARVRCWWLVEIDEPMLKRQKIVGSENGYCTGREIAPLIFKLFSDRSFDARWTLRLLPDPHASELA